MRLGHSSMRIAFDNSKNPRYLDSLGWVHYRLGNAQQALSYLEYAVAPPTRVSVMCDGQALSARAMRFHSTSMTQGLIYLNDNLHKVSKLHYGAGAWPPAEVMEGMMEFLVYRFKRQQDDFVVMDTKDEGNLTAEKCGMPDDELEKVGNFSEMGEKRVAFDEGLAKRSIARQGFYRFHAKSFEPVAEPPLSMP